MPLAAERSTGEYHNFSENLTMKETSAETDAPENRALCNFGDCRSVIGMTLRRGFSWK